MKDVKSPSQQRKLFSRDANSEYIQEHSFEFFIRPSIVMIKKPAGKSFLKNSAKKSITTQ